MSLSKQDALDLFRSDDLIGIGMEADSVRRQLHPEGVVTYIIDRNINYTNFCTEYCTFCAFYRPLKGPAAKEGYILEFDTIYDKIRETVELGGAGLSPAQVVAVARHGAQVTLTSAARRRMEASAAKRRSRSRSLVDDLSRPDLEHARGSAQH